MSDFEILHQDDALFVVVKPEKLLSVPGRADDNKDCLILRLQQRHPEARIVHRLDFDTSGLMVIARNADVHRELSRQFHDREVDKRYLALVWGQVADDAGEIDLPLRYDPPTKPRHVVDVELGRPALTRYQVLDRSRDHSRVALEPYTGRSHQLRVHMLALGHVILGDPLYASGEALAAAPRLLLHAEMLAFTHPVTGERLEFVSPAPF